MRINFINVFIFFGSLILLFSCGNGPKKIEAVNARNSDNYRNPSTNTSSTGIFNSSSKDKLNNSKAPVINNVVNQQEGTKTIEVIEVLPTDKYVYLKSREGDDEFWVAVLKQEVEVGDKFFFKGGLLKTNFESKEYNRVFDKVYLVSKLIPVDNSNSSKGKVAVKPSDSNLENSISDNVINHKDGSITIKELTDNPEKYENREIQLTGKCVKLNPNIMGRNWVHLQDDTNNDYDLVVTMDVAVPVGHIVTLSGTVILNKDFGAGYKYDLIVENADLIR
jgi:hypothetical protein